MTLRRKRILGVAAVLGVVALTFALNQATEPAPVARQGFVDLGGGFVPPTTMGTSGGGLATVTHDTTLTGSGTGGSPLGTNLSVSSPITGTGSSGSPLGTSIATSSPLTGTGSSGSPLSTSIQVTGPITGTGSSGSPLATSFSVTAPFSGTGSSGSPFAYIPGVSSPITGTGSAGSPLTTSISVTSPVTGTGSSGSPLGTSFSVTAPFAGTGSSGSPFNYVPSVSSPLSGTGTSGSPLTASISVNGTEMTGTGSSGSPLTTIHNGTVTSLTCGTGLSGGAITTSGTCALSMTAATCANGQAVTAVTATGGHTCGDTTPNSYGNTHFEWIDEFLANNCGATNTLLGNCGIWTQTLAGTSSSTTQVGNGARPGVMQISTGTSATGRGTLETGQTFDFGTGNNQFEWVGGFPTLSDVGTPTDAYAFFVGFGDVDTTINQTNGCGFYYDSQNVITGGANSGKVQNLECYCAKASTRTVYLLNGTGNSDESFALGTVSVAALTLPNTNILHLLVKATGTTRVEFYTVSGTTQTKVCDINTNMPASGSLMFAQMKAVKNAGTTARTWDVDVAHLTTDLTSARSP